MNNRIALLLAAAVLLTACGSLSKAESAGKAMAETACIVVKDPSKVDSMQTEGASVFKKYGFETGSDIDAYLATIQGTEELNTVTATVRDTLTATCGDELAAQNIDASAFANAMVAQ